MRGWKRRGGEVESNFGSVSMPMQSKSLRILMPSLVISLSLLSAGWIWARLMISTFQRREGVTALGSSLNAAYYEWWGLTVPGATTGFGLLLCGLVTWVLLLRHDDSFLLTAYTGYLVGLAGAFIYLFGALSFDGFE
jgi:hypothetical protein